MDPTGAFQMDEPEGMTRLQEEQRRAVQETQGRIEQMESFMRDYTALQDRLKTLPDKVTHDVMVPFGSLAMMPGQLIHTNEVMVLLGDNWFVERSAKQAVEIVDRRKIAIEEQIKEFKKQQGLLEPRLQFTSQLKETGQGDTFEIREDYDPEKEKAWREQHKKNVEAYKHDLKKTQKTETRDVPEEKTAQSDDQLWERLRELEIKERLGNEFALVGEEVTTSENTTLHKTVRWEDEEEEESEDDDDDISDDDDDDESDDDEEEEVVEPDGPRLPSKITFSHSNIKEEESTSEQGQAESSDGMSLKSPSDIYKHFCPMHKPKSILKPPKSPTEPITGQRSETLESKLSNITESVLGQRSEVLESRLTNVGPRQTQSERPEAFSGAVKERVVQPSVQGLPPSEPPKRISKFKQQRMSQQKR